MPKGKRRRRVRKKAVRKQPRCPNDNAKLRRSSSPGRYLCPKCDTLWTLAAIKSHKKSLERMAKESERTAA